MSVLGGGTVFFINKRRKKSVCFCLLPPPFSLDNSEKSFLSSFKALQSIFRIDVF